MDGGISRDGRGARPDHRLTDPSQPILRWGVIMQTLSHRGYVRREASRRDTLVNASALSTGEYARWS